MSGTRPSLTCPDRARVPLALSPPGGKVHLAPCLDAEAEAKASQMWVFGASGRLCASHSGAGCVTVDV